LGLAAACLAFIAIAQVSAAATAPDLQAEVTVTIPRKQNLAAVVGGVSFNERFGALDSRLAPAAFILPHRVSVEAVTSDSPAEGLMSTPSQTMLAASEAIVGTASMYDPGDATDLDAGRAETASGQFYDADDWTAAIQIDLRQQFGGVRYGRNYRPAYALVEAGDKRLIVRINDVGPLKPGRIIDLNVRAMRYFDPSMQAGLIAGVKVSPLAGEDYALGPVTGPMPVTVASRDVDVAAP
jgi:rare lipoprotein A